MNGELPEIPHEKMTWFEGESKTAYAKHEKTLRRSIDISVGFFDKLSALDGGSIALAASVIIALTAKPEFASGRVREIVHGLVVIVILLWASLICAVLHNFLSVRFSAHDAQYSEIDFNRTIIRNTLPIAKQIIPEIDNSVIDQIEKNSQEESAANQKKIVDRKERLFPTVRIVRYISAGAFLVAYTLVVFYLFQLW